MLIPTGVHNNCDLSLIISKKKNNICTVRYTYRLNIAIQLLIEYLSIEIQTLKPLVYYN